MRHNRRTLGVEELRELIRAAHEGATVMSTTGPERALIYRLAVATGLRYSELRSIRPGCFDWRAQPATVRVEAGYTKNGEVATMSIPDDLADDLADDLRPFVESHPSGSIDFNLPNGKGAKLIRHDLEAAGVSYVDASGRVYDFHSLRCQTAALLDASGVSPRVAQRLMRYSTPGLTYRYTRPKAHDLEAAALAMPSLRPTDGREAVAATGTESATPVQRTGRGDLPTVAHRRGRIPPQRVASRRDGDRGRARADWP